MKTAGKLMKSEYWLMIFYSAFTMLLAFSLSWLVLMKANFLYGLWHDVGGIKEGIEKYGPQNRYKRGFADTTREQRVDLFAQINHAVHNQGKGLQQIAYESPTSDGTRPLLRRPEVVHLQDVANLLDTLKIIPIIAVLGWLLAIGLMVYQRQRLPSLLKQSLALGALMALCIIILFIIGSERVFNALHIWIFPDDHQWFFYYQESLMSTMMLAPRLFGWIAASLVVAALVWYAVLHMTVVVVVKPKRG